MWTERWKSTVFDERKRAMEAGVLMDEIRRAAWVSLACENPGCDVVFKKRESLYKKLLSKGQKAFYCCKACQAAGFRKK